MATTTPSTRPRDEAQPVRNVRFCAGDVYSPVLVCAPAPASAPAPAPAPCNPPTHFEEEAESLSDLHVTLSKTYLREREAGETHNKKLRLWICHVIIETLEGVELQNKMRKWARDDKRRGLLLVLDCAPILQTPQRQATECFPLCADLTLFEPKIAGLLGYVRSDRFDVNATSAVRNMPMRTSSGVTRVDSVNVLLKWTRDPLDDIAADMTQNTKGNLTRYAEVAMRCTDTPEFRKFMQFPPSAEVKLEDCRTPAA